MGINKELMKGSTAVLLLSLLEREDMYGYQMTQRLALISEQVFVLKEGTLYPLLHSLENEEVVTSYWCTADNGKRRKYYRITDKGRSVLQEKREEWNIYTKAVNTVIGGACFAE